MNVGYARTSTVEQTNGLDAQQMELTNQGCEKIFTECGSAVKVRDSLNQALEFVREGDCFIVCKIDRLARSTLELNRIIDLLDKKQVRLKILNIAMDTHSPTGKMMITMLGAVAEFEREIMLERQKEGIARAKKAGKFKGRQPLPDTIKRACLNYLQVGLTKTWISEKLSISLTSVYRIMQEHNSLIQNDRLSFLHKLE